MPEPDVVPEPDVEEPKPSQPEASCILDGTTGDLFDCPVHLARAQEGFPPATQVKVNALYSEDVVKFVGVVDLKCVGGNCLETLMTESGGALSTGHVVTLAPDAADNWSGSGDLDISHPLDNAPVSQAYLDEAGAVVGESRVAMLRFELTAVPDDTETVTLSLTEAFAAGSVSLPVASQEDLLVTADAGSGCGDAVCFDGNPCTEDACVDGACVFTPMEGGCDDGNPCTTNDMCAEGVCVGDAEAASGESCTGDDLCTEIGTCDGQGGCAYDDALAVDCTSLAGQCGTASCNPATGACSFTPKTGEGCDDGSECTTMDQCDANGSCIGTPVVCDDAIPCTQDSCAPETGCVYTADDSACDDGNPCTANTCGAEGCSEANVEGGCDDGDSCTLDDVCAEGVCTGAPDVATCGCAVDADCAPLQAEKLCLGELACLDGVCAKIPGTEVICPSDGYLCQDGWTCAPETGECGALSETNCDDGLECTVDSCSNSKGCLYEVVDLCPLGPLCEISGAKDETVECVLRVARASAELPPATGANVRFGWDATKVGLEQLVDSYCFGASCWPFDALTCGGDGSGCSSQPLQSGHSMLLVPNDIADWADWISITFVHQSSVDVPVTPAVVDQNGEVGDDARVIGLRFKLLDDIPDTEPVTVEFTEASFDRVDLPLTASVESNSTGSVVVTGGAE